ncbi:MAG: signal recognition particle-docking protein FtsY [Myxococcaceae bacterium]|nr:signal recognition particle-docking protein FtsY [Myxococcaceae bacterium]
MCPAPMPRPLLHDLPLLGQTGAPPTSSGSEPAPAPLFDTSSIGNWIGLGVIVLFVVLAVLALRRRSARKREAAAKEPKPSAPAAAEARPPELPAPPPFKVELPKSEAERARLEAAEKARREAEALAQQRRALEAQGASEEARKLKEQEEALKREEYRAKKEAEREERERKKREREEAERLAKEAEERARAEEQARLAALAEEERRKIQAQAGRTLAAGLEKTRQQGFMARLNQLFGSSRDVDESVLAELEETLFTADIGVRTAASLVDLAREKAKKNELRTADGMKQLIRREIERIVDLPVTNTLEGGGPPHVVMVVGVNGAGKTTTIGKLAAKLTAQGKKVILAAGDTFRAAATEQLDVWADRAHAELVKGPEGGDPGAVVFEAAKKAKEQNAAVVIADTAGRLHTRAPLMEELKKVKRVLGKAIPGAPHEVLLVVDATMGQNAIQQARQFHEAVGVTAIALTKLDGTAKGGVIIGIADELKIPVVWVGVGEAVEDLRRFDPKEFVSALFD